MGLSLGKEVDTEVYIQNASKQHVIRVYSEEDSFFALVEDPSEPVGNFGRADLVNFSAHQVYEIKHVRSWQYGYAEARWYQGRMELDPNPMFAGNWFLGDQFLTDGPKPISDWPDVSGNYSQDWELVADFSRNAPAGVIVYYAREKRNDEQPEWDFDPAIETLPLTTPYTYILLRGALKGCGSPSPQPVPQPGYGVFPPLIPFYILEQYLLPYYESVPS